MRTNYKRLGMEGMLFGHKVPTTALPEEQVFHSSSFKIFASCLYSVCVFAECIHWTLFIGSEGFCIGMTLRGYSSPTCHTKQESFQERSWDVLTCLQTFRGKMVTMAQPTPVSITLIVRKVFFARSGNRTPCTLWSWTEPMFSIALDSLSWLCVHEEQSGLLKPPIIWSQVPRQLLFDSEAHTNLCKNSSDVGGASLTAAA